jgi:hypothetical protein
LTNPAAPRKRPSLRMLHFVCTPDQGVEGPENGAGEVNSQANQMVFVRRTKNRLTSQVQQFI